MCQKSSNKPEQGYEWYNHTPINNLGYLMAVYNIMMTKGTEFC